MSFCWLGPASVAQHVWPQLNVVRCLCDYTWVSKPGSLRRCVRVCKVDIGACVRVTVNLTFDLVARNVDV